MHFCTATVNLAGSMLMQVPRTEFNPISWPEIEVLRAIHGDDAVVDPKPFVTVEQSPRAEKERLLLTYGSVVEELFPGRNPQIEMEAPKAKLPAKTPEWKNPIDRDPAIWDTPPEERSAAVAAAEDAEAKTAKPKNPFN
jgi:hypothetical protein